MIQQGAEKLTKLSYISEQLSCCKGCTMGCGGVWFGREPGLPTFWGKLMPPDPENEGSRFL